MSANSTTVDERIVSMKFDNKQFEKGVKESIKTIGKLKKTMDFDESVESVRELEKATSTFDTSKMEKSLEALEKRFSALGIAGMRAVENVTDSVMRMAKNVATKPIQIINKAFGQIKSGGLNRALKLENARFQLTGLLSDLKNVDKQVVKLLEMGGPVQSAVKGTAYGLDAAAGAAAQLVASGVKIKNLEAPLTSISGAAAMTGRSYEDIANIFATVAGQGKLMTMQLRQFEAANVNAAVTIAKYLGKTEAEVRQMISNGKIDFETFSKAMEVAFAGTAKKANDTFNGAMSNVNAALSRIGAGVAASWNESMRKIFVDLIPMIDNVNKLLSSDEGTIGALTSLQTTIKAAGKEIQKAMGVHQLDTWSKKIKKLMTENYKLQKQGASKKDPRIKENLKEIAQLQDKMKNFNSEFQNVLSGAISILNKIFEQLPKLVKPAVNVFKGLWNILKAIGSVLKPIAEAFFDIFPAPTIEGIKEATESFAEFTSKLKLSAEASEIVRKIFRGLFAALSVGANLIKTIGSAIVKLVKNLSSLGKGVGTLMQGVATVLGSISYYLNVVIVSFNYVINYFGGLSFIVQALVGSIATGLGAVGAILIKVFEPVGDFFWGLGESLGLLSEKTEGITFSFSSLSGIFIKIGTVLKALWTDLRVLVTTVGATVYTWIKDKLGGAFTFLTNGIQGFGKIVGTIFTGFYDNIKKTGSIVKAVIGVFKNFGIEIASVLDRVREFANPIFSRAIDLLATVFDRLSIAIGNLADNFTPGRIAGLAFIAIMVIMSIQVSKLIKTITEGIPVAIKAFTQLPLAASNTLNQVNGLIGDLRKKLEPNSVAKITDVIKSLTIALGTLAFSLYMLSSIEPERLKSTAITLGLLTAGFVALTTALAFLGKHIGKHRKEFSAGFRQLSVGMLAMSGSVLVLSFALKTLDGVDSNGLLKKAVALGMITAVLGGVAAMMGKFAPEFTKGAAGILFFALGIGRVVAALVKLANQPMWKVYNALPVLVAIMGMFGILSVAVSKIRLPSALGLLAMILMLKMCVNDIDTLMSAVSKVNPIAFITVMAGLLSAFTSLAVLMKFVANDVMSGIKDLAKALILIAGAIFALSMIVKLFEGISLPALAKGLVAITVFGGLFAAFMYLAQYTEKAHPVKFAASLLIIAGAIGMLGGIAALFGLIPVNMLTKGMTVITIFSGIFAGIMVLSKFTEKAQPLKTGGMFLMMAGAISMLVGIVVVLGMLDLREITQGTLSITALIGVMSLMVYVSDHLEKVKPEEIGNMFLKLGGAIMMMATCVFILGKYMSVEEIARGGGCIAAFLVVIGLMQTGLKGEKAGFWDTVKSTLASVLAVAMIMAVVAGALWMLQDYNWQQILSVTAAIAITMLSLSAAMRIMSKTELPSPKNAASLVVAAASMIPVAVALSILSGMNWESLLAGALGLGGCMIAMGTAFKIMGEIKMGEFDAGKFLEASLVMVVIAGSLLIAANQPWDQLLAAAVGISAALIAYSWVFQWLTTVPSIDKTVIEAFVLGSLSLAVIGFSLAEAAGAPWQSLLGAGAAISMVLFGYAAVFKSLANEQMTWEQFLSAAVPLVTAIFVTKGIAEALTIVAGQPWQNLLAGAAAISMTLLAYAGSFKILSTIDMDSMFSAAVAMLAGVLAMMAIANVLSGLAAYDWQSLLAAGAAISAAMLAFGVAFSLLTFVADKCGPGAIEKACEAIVLGAGAFALAFDEVIIIVGGVIAGIGALNDEITDGKLENWIDSGGGILAKIGDAIGGFIGGIGKGIMEKIGAGLPALGEGLAGFATNAEPFFTLIDGFKPELATAAESMAKVLLIIGGAELLNTIENAVSFFTGGLFNKGNTMADNLGMFGTAMKTFQDNATGVKPETIKTLSEAALNLAALEDAIPNSGGFFQKITGTADWEGTTKGLTGFATMMQKLSASMTGTNAISKSNLENFSTGAKYIVDVVNEMPRDNGLLQTFTGSIDWYSFKTGITGFAKGLQDLSKMATTIDQDALKIIKDCSMEFIDMAQQLPNSGGVVGWWCGNNDIDDFGQQIQSYGQSMVNFASTVKGMNEGDTKVAVGVGENIVALLSTISTIKSNYNLSAGEALEAIQTNVPLFGTAMKDFSNNVSGLSVASCESAADAVTYIAAIFGAASGTTVENFGAFSTAIQNLGTALKDLSASTENVNDENIEEFVTQTKKLVTTFNESFDEGVDFKDMKDFSKSVESLNNAFSLIKTDNNDSIETFKTNLSGLGTTYKEFGDNIKAVDEVDTKKFTKTVKALLKNFSTEKGEKLMDFGNLSKFAKSMGQIAKAAEAAGKADGQGNFQDLANSLKDLATNYTEVINVMNGVTDAQMQSFIDNIAAMQERFKEMGKIKTKNGTKLADSIKAIADAAKSGIDSALESIDKALSSFETKGKDIIDALVKGLGNEQKIKNLSTAAETAVNKFTSSIKTSGAESSGKNVVQGFTDGLNNKTKLDGVSRAAANIGKTALEALNKKVKVESPSKATAETGMYTVMGFVKGVDQNIKKVGAAGAQMGNSALTGLKESLDIHSPSGFTLEAAYQAAQGFINGCKEKAQALFGSGFSFGGNFMDGLSAAIKSVNKGDFSGDKVFAKIKDSLGLNNLGDLMKDTFSTEDFDAAMADALKNGKGGKGVGSANSDSGKAAKGAGSAAGKAAKEGFTEEMKLTSLLMARYIKGDKLMIDAYGKNLKKIAKQLGVTVDQYRLAITAMRDDLKDFSKTAQKVLSSSPNMIAKYVKGYKDASKSSKAVVKSFNTTYAAGISSISNIANAEIEGYKKHIKELEKLRKQYNKTINSNSKKVTKKEKKEAKKRVEAINKEIKKTQNKIKKANKSPGTSMVNNFAQQLYENSDDYKESKKNIEKYTKKYAKLQKNARKYLKTIGSSKASEKEKKKAYDNLQKTYEKMKDYEDKINVEWDKIAKGPNKALKEWRKATKEMAKEFMNLASYDISGGVRLSGFDAMTIPKGVLEETTSGYDALAEAVSNAGSKFSIFASETSKSFDMFSVSLEKSSGTANSALNSSINLLERFTKVGTVAKEALFENADSQLEAYEEFMQGIAKMNEMGFNEEIVAEMAKQGPQALNYIRGYLSMTSDEVSKYNQRYAKKLSYESDKALAKASKTTRSYVDAIKEEVLSNQTFEDSLSALAAKGVDSGVIKQFREMGKDQAQGYVDSLLDETDSGISELNSLYRQFQNKSFLDSVKEQAESYAEYADLMNQLRKTALDPSIIKEIEEMGQDDAKAYARSILANVGDIPSINEYYWQSQSGDVSVLDSMKSVNAQYEEYYKRIAELSERGYSSNVVEYVSGLGLEEGTKLLNRLDREWKAAGDKAIEYVQEFNEEYAKSQNGGKSGAKSLIDNVKSQINALDDYNADMENLADRLAGGQSSIYYQYLKEMGIEGANYVKALAQGTEEDIAEFQAIMDEREKKNNEERIKDLKAQQLKKFQTMADFGKNLRILAAAGANTDFLQSILDMGVAEGSQVAEAYANMAQMDPSGWATFRDGIQKESDKAVKSFVNVAEEAFTLAANYKNLDPAEVWNAVIGLDSDGYLPESVKENCTKSAKGVVDTTELGLQSYLTTPTVTEKMQQTGEVAGKNVATGTKEGIKASIEDGSLAKAITSALKSAFSSKSITKNMSAAGKAFIKGVKKAFADDKSTLKAAESLASKIKAKFSAYLKESKGKTIAKNMCLGLINGFNSKKTEVVNSAKTIASKSYNSIYEYLNYDKGYELGDNIAQGLINGMNNRLYEVQAVAAKLAAAAAAAMKAAAKVNSPSKLTMQTGESMGEGLVVGMQNTESWVANSASSLAEYAIKAMKTSAEMANDVFNDTLNVSPVIKPVLDLSNITNRAQSLGMEFDAQIKSKANTNDESENQNANVTQNFVQNNYSPKALSREEIYRQTKNQFAMVREAVSI